ncbi:inhibitor of apoptosis-promoting Bax1-domain-containing protein [Blyttiomyces helicus]|uniref:Inhibitor of apoptosis-promoting Bax1-domain-containing protein n=1 Tax=Blyttiomyces helicus TaxID=388810 RepID=A0A4P9WJB9_9FUNG|nr:inhibitor of apoptosis-promoting Bax1-domain-containing protein [Blyttiomyces helicus]|eukprot:RKO92924.1 inhibitor of apoptosis-promoting Bax1-domain-containing protein [Blyttiomyces helicus]
MSHGTKYQSIPGNEDAILPAASSSSAAPPAYPTETDLPDDFKYGVNVAEAAESIRSAFVRKVYTILAIQLGTTSVVSAFFLYNETIKTWAQEHVWAMFVSWLGTLGVLFALIAYRRSHPTNLYLLSAFTLLEAYSIGTVVTFYDSRIVLQAVIITFALFVGLTLFTFQTKYDFSSWAPFLFGAIRAVIIAGLVQMFFPFNRTLDLVIAIFTAVLFCAYILYDTQQILQRLSPEEYIIASIELYLDILNLFLAILRILNNNRD